MAKTATAAPQAPKAADTGPRGVAPASAPMGQRLVRTMGPGNLSPGVGLRCIKAGKALYCGRMTGIAYAVRRHPNAKDVTRESLAFAGKFLCVLASGEVIQSLECYVPSVVERAFAGMLESHAAQEVRFALEVWAEPDEVTGRKTATGYVYVAHDLMAPQARDPLLELAAEAGVIEAPAGIQGRLAAPEGYDPETGEVALQPA